MVTKEGNYMATNFSELVFENQNSIAVKLTVEAPIGTPVINTDVRENATIKLYPNATDVRSVRITVIAGGPEHTDVESFDLNGSPFHLFFETMKVRAVIGSLHGVVSAAF